MVYVPQGDFFIGSGNNTAAVAEFARADRPSTVAEPFLVTSEAAISIRARSGVAGFVDANEALNNHAGPIRPGGLTTTSNVFTGNPSTAAPVANSIGILGEGEAGIPSAFPKGHQAFYMMKYEITQGAYVNFLNTLTLPQQLPRTRSTFESSPATHRAMLQSNASDRNYIKVVRQGIIEFGVDMNNNNIMNELADGHGVACAMNIFDLMAYLDFSGLRPMTELEFEKAARGPREAIPNEFAWGSTFWNSQTAQTGPALAAPGQHNAWFINGGLPTERPFVANVNHMAPSQWAVGRNGMFANDTSGRVISGASYWGIMELSSNLWELVINVTNAESRAYTGQHGDGRLTPGGSQNVTGWPVSHFGFGLRGGSAAEAIGVASGHTISARHNAFWNTGVPNSTMGTSGNSWNVGGRGVRTAHTQSQLP
jgi:formylglycine-generating enzyme required for sulfatase activity